MIRTATPRARSVGITDGSEKACALQVRLLSTRTCSKASLTDEDREQTEFEDKM